MVSNQFQGAGPKKRAKPSTMFIATYEDGQTAYFVIDGKVEPADEYRVMDVARKCQLAGALPPGVIKTVKRVR